MDVMANESVHTTPWTDKETVTRTIEGWIQEDTQMIRELKAARQLALPDWCIGAGYVRNLIWDKRHGYVERTPLNDVDVVYYDSMHTDEDMEKGYERQLQEICPGPNWSCKNQARMHVVGDREPYTSTSDAMMNWPEVMTAIGVRLEEDDTLTIVSPWGEQGLRDLWEMRIRRSPKFRNEAYFNQRVASKQWLTTWPLARLE